MPYLLGATFSCACIIKILIGICGSFIQKVFLHSIFCCQLANLPATFKLMFAFVLSFSSDRFGVYWVNFTDPTRPRVAKDSVAYLKKLISDNGFPEEGTAQGL